MVIKKHIEYTLEKMLSVEKNKYYSSLLFDVVNQITGEDIGFDDLVITSTAEHCTIPNSFNTISNILTIGKGFSNIRTSKRKYFLVLSGSLIPLDNADYPRGFYYNATLDKIDKIPIWEQKHRKSFPLILPSVDSNRIPSRNFLFNQSQCIDFIVKVFNEQSVPYYQQICLINNHLYKMAFKSEEKPPKIIFLSLEDVALRLLNLLIKRQDVITETLIFNNYQNTFDALFNVPTCWNNEKGSFLFWYEHNTKLFPLKFQGKKLESEIITIGLQKEEIVNLLSSKKLYPCVFISLLLTNIITNLPTLGGKRQGIYLEKMINYFNSFNMLKTSNEINNVNWGIHPNIAKYLNTDLKEVSGIYLISNLPNSKEYEEYISNEELLL